MASTSGFSVMSGAFEEGGGIPRAYTCDGDDRSPPLSWSGAPEGTAAFALIVDDSDARGFVHWVVANIPGSAVEMSEAVTGTGGLSEGRNNFGRTGYGGPCPPSGTHRYAFRLYALSRALEVGATPTAAEVRTAMDGLVLAEATLTATYTRG